ELVGPRRRLCVRARDRRSRGDRDHRGGLRARSDRSRPRREGGRGCAAGSLRRRRGRSSAGRRRPLARRRRGESARGRRLPADGACRALFELQLHVPAERPDARPRAQYGGSRAENAKNYEAGTKLDLAGGRMALSAAVFRLDRNNVKNTDPADPSRLVLTGQQRTDGAQLSAAGNLSKRWKLTGGYAKPRAAIVENTAAPTARRAGGARA